MAGKAQDKFKKLVGKRLETRRIELKLNRTEVAELAKLPSGQLAHYEAGRRLPGAIIIFKLCKALNLSADTLLGLDK